MAMVREQHHHLNHGNGEKLPSIWTFIVIRERCMGWKLVGSCVEFSETSLPLPTVSQVELLKLFGPERPELDLTREVVDVCRQSISNLKYSLSSKIFLSPPPALCFTFSKERILEPTSQSSFSSWICGYLSLTLSAIKMTRS